MSLKHRSVDLGWALAVVVLAGCNGSETNANDLAKAAQAVNFANLSATIKQTSSWGAGYCANIDITNNGAAAASTWTVVLELNQANMYTSWNGNFSGSSSRKTVTPVVWNATVNPGATLQAFGYCANTTGPNATPQVISPLGNSGAGGASNTGGTSTAGGSIAAGGVVAAGGSLVSAGSAAIAGGGGDAAGGSVAAGGIDASGGSIAAGGVVAVGGSFVSAGSAAIAGGGGDAAGGSVAAGGNSTSGGTIASGGISSAGSPSTYVPVGEYLQEPDRAVSVMKSLADFRAKARDNVNGGFYSFVNLDGTVSSDHRKGFVTQTRDAWTFSRAFMVTGDDAYLDHAAHALEHLYSHGWDNTYGGWYFTGDEMGNLTPYSTWWDPNTWKWSFVQHYALLGIGAYCDAARDAETCAWMKKGRNFLDTKMWDSASNRLGYYDQTDRNLSNPRGKGFTPTADALTTNGIQMDLLWPNAAYHQRMVELANIVTDRLAANMDLGNVRFGYPENYDTNWGVDTTQSGGDVGHILKSAWVLARVYMRHPDARYRDAARKLIYEVLDNGGWDYIHGVPYTHYDWNTGQTTKQAECWQIEQAVTSGLSNWYIAQNQQDKDTFLQMADRALQFFVNYVIDHTNGGTYKMNTIQGAPADGKSNFYNVEYHSTETFYFTYLYGNLLLHRTPVALYYRVPASANQQVLQLNPVSVDDASLQIQSVTLNGSPLTTFSASSREVTLVAGQGGKLRVVFGPAA
jgi:mannose/cellobiose epimerase-like protein (N-acyl-D-glucosamine 2-epimerase family)